MEFLLIVLLTVPSGEVEQHVMESQPTAWECEITGVLFESFNPNANWYCEEV